MCEELVNYKNENYLTASPIQTYICHKAQKLNKTLQ